MIDKYTISSRSQVTVDSEEYENLKATVNSLTEKVNTLMPVELYNGDTAGNFTLSQDINNFRTIEIIYKESASTNGNAPFDIKTAPAELQTGVALNAFSASTSGGTRFIQIFSSMITISGTTATRSTTTYAYNAGGGTNLITVPGSGNISVCKVYGYK